MDGGKGMNDDGMGGVGEGQFSFLASRFGGVLDHGVFNELGGKIAVLFSWIKTAWLCLVKLFLYTSIHLTRSRTATTSE